MSQKKYLNKLSYLPWNIKKNHCLQKYTWESRTKFSKHSSNANHEPLFKKNMSEAKYNDPFWIAAHTIV